MRPWGAHQLGQPLALLVGAALGRGGERPAGSRPGELDRRNRAQHQRDRARRGAAPGPGPRPPLPPVPAGALVHAHPRRDPGVPHELAGVLARRGIRRHLLLPAPPRTGGVLLRAQRTREGGGDPASRRRSAAGLRRRHRQLHGRASATPRDVDAGESIKFKVEWTGRGNLQYFTPPEPSRSDAFAGFRVYGKTETKSLERRTVVYDIAPRSAEVKEIPPLQLPVFDPSTGRYTSVATEPLAINVRALARASGLEDAATGPALQTDLRDVPGTLSREGELPRPGALPGAGPAGLAAAPVARGPGGSAAAAGTRGHRWRRSAIAPAANWSASCPRRTVPARISRRCSATWGRARRRARRPGRAATWRPGSRATRPRCPGSWCANSRA
jgi:hypothetical protein